MNIINVVLSAIFSGIFVLLSINNIAKEKINFKIFLKFASIMLTLGVFSCIYFTGIVRLVTTIMITTMALYISLFNKDINRSFYYTIVYEILAFIIEIVISIIFVLVLKLDLNNYESFSFSLFVFSICNCILVYLITKIKFIQNIVNKFDKKISKSNKEWAYILFVIIILIMLETYNRYNLNNNINFYINIFLFVFVLISVSYVIYNKIQKDNYEIKYNNTMEYVQKYEKIINEQGKKNHEYNNQLMVIKGYSHDPEKLEEYLNLIIDEHKCGQNYTIRQLSNFPDGGIKGLIYHKLSKMDDCKIKYYLYIDKDSKNIFEKKFDLKTYQDITKLLGVFLDNAIDASKDIKNAEIELDIKNDDNCIIIKISNTFKNNEEIKQIGKKGFTTKGTGHGYGLSIVKDINKHNDNIETFSDIENDKFIQNVLIYYK